MPKDLKGLTPLDIAEQNNHKDIIEILKSPTKIGKVSKVNGIFDVNDVKEAETNEKNILAYSLKKIAENGCEASYQNMVEKEADKNPEIENGETLLHLVAKNGHVKLCEAITKNLLKDYSRSKKCLEMIASDANDVDYEIEATHGKMPTNIK